MKKLLRWFSLLAVLAHLAPVARTSVHEYHYDHSTIRVLTIYWESYETNDWGSQVNASGFFEVWLYAGDSYDQDDEAEGYDPSTGAVWGTTYFVMFDDYRPDPNYETWESFDDPYIWSYGTWSPSPAGTWEDQLCNQSRTKSRWHSIGERSNLGNTRHEGGYTEYETEHQTVAGTKPLNWRTFDEVTWDWHEVGSWNPDPSAEWEDRQLTQVRQILRTHRTGRRNDRGDEDSIGGYNEEGTTSRVVAGSRPLNWRFWENRLTRDWYDTGNWSPSPSGSYFWEYISQSIPRLQDWSEWAINDRGDSRLSRVFTVGGTFYRTVTGTQVAALSAVQVGIPGGAGAVNLGVGNASGRVTLPNGITVTGNSNGAGSVSVPNTVVPGGVTVSINGGQVTVTTPGGVAVMGAGGSINLGGGVVVSVTPSGNASVVLPGGMSVSVGPGGGSVGFPGGTVVRVAGDGRIDVELPPGAPPLLAKAVNAAGMIYGAGAGHIMSVRDAVTLLVGPLPSNPLLDSLDLGVTIGGITQVGLRQNNDGATTWLPIFVRQVMPAMALAVDANRDGVIKLPSEDATDATSAASPFRFWLNDDDDSISGTKNIDRVPRESQDWTDHRIECERDLEDFARLQIYTQGLNAAFKNGDLHLGLKWANTTGTPAIQIFKNRETDGGTGYLNTANNPNLPQQLVQWALVDARTESEGPIAGQRTIEGSGVFILPSSLFANLTDAQPKTHLLFEGCKPGKGQLKLVILKKDGTNYTEIGKGPGVWLDLKSIKSMYEGPGTAFEQPAGETPQGIVFVHGWNMSPEGSVNFAETMFKRLWQRGFKGRFVSLRWNTNYSDAFDNVPLIGEAVEGYLADYNGSERVAWQSGAIVKAAVDGLPSGYSRNIVAHSMGNIIAGSSLLAGVSFDNYVLMQAAVPASCYDDRALLQQAERPSPQTYAGFRPDFWEAGVSPDDDPVPETRALSYRGRLSASVGNLVNFYLPDDHATTYAWEFNNDQTKPISGYGYTRGAPVVLGTQRAIWRQIGTGPSAYYDSLTDPFVAMPFVCRSWSKVVGADSRTAGVIQGSFNLNSSPLFFDTEHSAQFNRSIQVLRPYYDELLRRLGMEPTP